MSQYTHVVSTLHIVPISNGLQVDPQEPPAGKNTLGVVSMKASIQDMIREALEDARYLCVEKNGEAPDVKLGGTFVLISFL